MPAPKRCNPPASGVDIGPGVQSFIDEVRLSEGDAVRLLVLGLQGRCITPADVAARYPQVKNADFPQPNNPDPVSYRRVDMGGVRVSFGFRGALPGCLAHVARMWRARRSTRRRCTTPAMASLCCRARPSAARPCSPR